MSWWVARKEVKIGREILEKNAAYASVRAERVKRFARRALGIIYCGSYEQ